MKKILPALVIALTLLMASCTSTKAVNGAKLDPVYVTNTKKIIVLPPSFMKGEQDCQALLELKFGENTFTLLAYVFADNQSMEINLYNDFGTDMGSLFFDGLEAVLDCSLVPPELKAEYIINDLEIAWYDFEAMVNHYKDSKLTLTKEPADDGEIRKVYSGNKLICEITVSDTEVHVKNYLRGYEYRLQQ